MNTNYFPIGGTDYLELWTDATVEINGIQETIEFTGSFVVNRSHVDPSSHNQIVTQILMMNARGESKNFGPVIVYMNPEAATFGNKVALVEEVEGENPGFFGYFDVMFEMRAQAFGLTLFNKTPVYIQATAKSLPPIGALGLSEEGMSVDLYDRANPDGPPVGKMLATRKKVGAYVDLSFAGRTEAREEAKKVRQGITAQVKA